MSDSDDDLFDAFQSKPSTHGVGDKMAELEAKKSNEAKEKAAALLQELMSTSEPSQSADTITIDDDDSARSTVKKTQLGKRKQRKTDESIIELSDDESDAKKIRSDVADTDEVHETVRKDINRLDQLVESGENFLAKAPQIQVHHIETEERCTHEVCIPPGGVFKPLEIRDTEPAKTYPFQLDPFQKESINCIDNYQSVLVSAHTSAGKTVVAQYAIALSLRNKQRVIYTSPIKALSNQKYRELKEEFSDVGLMTGDVTISPNASVLVMTTEILRSMLYRGSEVMREVGWVVFDEIHYMRDKDRGVVWEETIILLPHEVHFVFLSATIPNACQFAEWICFLHNQPCHVVYTEYRPTPLQHFIYPAGAKSLYEVVDGRFLEDKFNMAMSFLQTPEEMGIMNFDPESGKPARVKRGSGGANEAVVIKLVKHLSDQQLLPAITFSFSRRECEAYATMLKDVDFNEDDEKVLIREIYENCINGLSAEDRQLPQIQSILPFLERGIGIHHSGLLPILKEVIEMMFGEGLIKVLFATETFSMGLNMPARTVIFTAAQKFDGTDYRWLHSGEYIQMSGRAGRRGMDARGVVILTVDQKMNADIAKQIIKGKPDPLNSQFRLTYNMVLNMMRVEAIYPEWMLQRSFAQFQSYGTLPQLMAKRKKCFDAVSRIKVPREQELRAYHSLETQLHERKAQLLAIMKRPAYIVPFLQPGRLFKICCGEKNFGWGPLIAYERKTETNPADPRDVKAVYTLQVLLNFAPFQGKMNNFAVEAMPAKRGEPAHPEVVPVLLDSVQAISAVRIQYPADLTSMASRQQTRRVVEAALERFKGELPLLDPIEDMKIKEDKVKDLIDKLKSLEQAYFAHPIRAAPNFDDLYAQLRRKLDAENDLRAAKGELKKAVSLLKMDELRVRQRILRRLNYCDENGVIVQKGRVACEIASGDELLLTELLFAGVFNDLSPQNCAALLSCLVAEEKAECPKMSDELQMCLRQLQEHARRIARVSVECKMEDIDEERYVDKFRPTAMNVVHQWCSGKSFLEIMKDTQMFEGSVIRTMRRLEELLREMRNAAHAIGNMPLREKFDETRERMKRGIVFAASLYLVGEDDDEEEARESTSTTARS